MENRETARMRKYGESKTTRIMMATVPHLTSGLGLRKFQADGFLLTPVYQHSSIRQERAIVRHEVFICGREHIQLWVRFVAFWNKNQCTRFRILVILNAASKIRRVFSSRSSAPCGGPQHTTPFQSSSHP